MTLEVLDISISYPNIQKAQKLSEEMQFEIYKLSNKFALSAWDMSPHGADW